MGLKKTAKMISKDQTKAAEVEIVEQSKRIDFYMTEYSVELLAQKMDNSDFIIPSYQREYTWDLERKSRFIESLVMGLPIPFLFFWEMDDGHLEIVDGSQRLRTIQEFTLGNLRLGELESLSRMSGFKFLDLPPSRQRKINNRSIRGIILNEHADQQARFDLFDRINTSSKVANKAEIRRGALSGPFMDLIIELGANVDFVLLAPASVKLTKERHHEELVVRFFAFGDGLEGYKDRPSDFLFDYVKRRNSEAAEDNVAIDVYRQRFLNMLSFVSAAFPFGFKRTPNGSASPKTRFEAISIGSYMAQKDRPQLLPENLSVESWIDSKEFKDIIGADGANAIARLRNRINFVRDKLLED